MGTRLLIAALALAAGSPVLGQSVVVHVLDGESAEANFGAAVRGAGDVDQDGRADLIVGAPRPYLSPQGAGKAHVYSGLDRSLLYTFVGASSGDRFGVAVDGGGDANDDGVPDLLVGAPRDDTAAGSAGRCVLYSGADGQVLHEWYGAATGDELGSAVAFAGDVDMDGFDDVLVGSPRFDGAPGSSGKAQVFSGQTGLELYSYEGVEFGELVGAAVDGVGDVNGDQRADFAVSAPGAGAERGVVRLYSGIDGSLIRAHLGVWSPYGHDQIGERLGSSLAGAGDVDGDLVGDVFAGAPYHGPYIGRALAFSGATGAVIHTFHGARMDESLGIAVGAGGDVDDDGRGDLLIANDLGYIGEPNEVDLRSGSDGSSLLALSSDEIEDFFGRSLAIVGDVDGDGVDDVAFGIPLARTANGAESGSVRVISGIVHGDLDDDYCFGETASCPCGNAGLPDRGCDNAQDTGGFRLDVAGHAPDFAGGGTAQLVGSGYPAMSQPGVTLIRSGAAQDPPTIFGDGLLCISPSGLVRIGATLATNGTSLNPVMHGAGAGTYYYQVWVRSMPVMFCDPTAAYNLSNGVSITWP